MLYRFGQFSGFSLSTNDGAIGSLKDLFFSDDNWKIRYFVVETGSWLNGQQVLIAPEAIESIDRDQRMLLTNLTQQQIKESPPTESDQPISRQYENRLHAYYGWLPYWQSPVFPGVGIYPPIDTTPYYSSETPEDMRDRLDAYIENSDPRLRSCKEVKGYALVTQDGELGHLDDFVVDPKKWAVKFLVIDTRNWFPGRKVLLEKDWVESVDWIERRVLVKLPRQIIKDSPTFDDNANIDENYEADFAIYYEQIHPKQASAS